MGCNLCANNKRVNAMVQPTIWVSSRESELKGLTFKTLSDEGEVACVRDALTALQLPVEMHFVSKSLLETTMTKHNACK